MKFNGFCKQTSTGLWFGITEEKPTRTEQKWREILFGYNKPKDDVLSNIIVGLFREQVLSRDFMRELMEDWINEDKRQTLEIGYVYTALCEKRQHSQECIINCITYVRSGLVKYNKELKVQ